MTTNRLRGNALAALADSFWQQRAVPEGGGGHRDDGAPGPAMNRSPSTPVLGGQSRLPMDKSDGGDGSRESLLPPSARKRRGKYTRIVQDSDTDGEDNTQREASGGDGGDLRQRLLQRTQTQAKNQTQQAPGRAGDNSSSRHDHRQLPSVDHLITSMSSLSINNNNNNTSTPKLKRYPRSKTPPPAIATGSRLVPPPPPPQPPAPRTPSPVSKHQVLPDTAWDGGGGDDLFLNLRNESCRTPLRPGVKGVGGRSSESDSDSSDGGLRRGGGGFVTPRRPKRGDLAGAPIPKTPPPPATRNRIEALFDPDDAPFVRPPDQDGVDSGRFATPRFLRGWGAEVERFRERREGMARSWYRTFNREVFDGRLPADLVINWNARLLTTAG
ncbi:unnamed protein product [Vitrella brassicaformis CCMP3155]|uniref:Uncharacterized protein n=1 Tax=Vitrella brassicaformis (strain CCMP3155) TaxID=1169540 RepID=A0A0G4EVP3_VITBC|nr:unnamed protein product [Vitrella brassicaformis CCMP3155]|eukprot:CEM02717.1 unnamed protein product [Vitrella brassicaformis CCMP3155]